MRRFSRRLPAQLTRPTVPAGRPRTYAWILAVACLAVARSALSAQPAPQLFAKAIISTAGDEFGGALSPDAQTFCFAKRTPSTLRSSTIVLCIARAKGEGWGTPEIAPFSGQYKDLNPAFSPDGTELLFASTRPVGTEPKRETDLWVVRRTATGWGEPVNLGPPINTDQYEIGASVTGDGTLFFSAGRSGGKGGFDIYRSARVDGKYAEPENLGEAVNTEFNETDPYIAPDGSYLLFVSLGRPDAAIGGGAPYPRSDIYVSHRNHEGWSPAQRLGETVNSTANESSPFVSPDGKTLFFTSERGFVTIPMKQRLTYEALERGLHGPGNGLGDIYRVDLAAAGVVR